MKISHWFLVFSLLYFGALKNACLEEKYILLIQEDIIILKILESLVLSKGFSCKAITSLTGLDIEDQNINFDFIISDILFEGIAPLDYVGQVQEIISHKNLLIVTSMGQENVRKEITTLNGIKGFFSVPFDLDHIEEILDAS